MHKKRANPYSHDQPPMANRPSYARAPTATTRVDALLDMYQGMGISLNLHRSGRNNRQRMHQDPSPLPTKMYGKGDDQSNGEQEHPHRRRDHGVEGLGAATGLARLPNRAKAVHAACRPATSEADVHRRENPSAEWARGARTDGRAAAEPGKPPPRKTARSRNPPPAPISAELEACYQTPETSGCPISR